MALFLWHLQAALPAGDGWIQSENSTTRNVWRQLVPAAHDLTIRASQRRAVQNFGGIIIPAFGFIKLSRRHAEFRRVGMRWFYRDYIPHVAFALDDVDRREIRPFDGRLCFGPEIFKPDPILDSLPTC